MKTGCEFEVKANADIDATLYISDDKQSSKQQEFVVTEFTKSVTKKGRESQMQYFKTPLQAKRALQLVVNSPNVIVYTAQEGYCPTGQPSDECYQKVFNYHNPVIYEPEKNTNLLLAVEVLDNCEYTLTRINVDDEFIELKDGLPFTYLMDDHEDKVVFKFKLEKKEAVSFNLISPLNSLYLLVENSNKMPSTTDMNIASTDGYLSFTKAEVKNL